MTHESSGGILVTGSIAYDTIMVFPDRFRNHLLADQLHILNVCFLTPEMRRVARLAQRLGHVDAVQAREAQVEDDQVGQERVGLVERGDAVAGDPHLVALHAQRALEDLRDRVVVLDHQHAGGTFEIGHLAVDGTARV